MCIDDASFNICVLVGVLLGRPFFLKTFITFILFFSEGNMLLKRFTHRGAESVLRDRQSCSFINIVTQFVLWYTFFLCIFYFSQQIFVLSVKTNIIIFYGSSFSLLLVWEGVKPYKMMSLCKCFVENLYICKIAVTLRIICLISSQRQLFALSSFVLLWQRLISMLM